MADTLDLYTTVKNIGSTERFFGYLGRHGKSLAAAATTTIFGNLQDQPGWTLRKQQSLERDLLAGVVTIINTPRPILKDTAADAPLANPSVQATVATSTGGSLQTGFYKAAYTFITAWGETTVGTSLSAEVEVPDATDDRLVVTVPAANSVTNCTGVNVYLTARAASTGQVLANTLRKVGTVTGGTTTLNVDTLPAISGSNPQPPSANTTEAPVMHGVKVTDATLGITDPSWGRYVDE